MKKLILILVMCFAAFAASAQCPPLNLVQNAKWKFIYSQCFQDTAVYSYVAPSRVGYFDANGNLTTITYAQLGDSIGVSSPSGNQWNIQYYDGGNFGSSTNFNYNGFNGIFYIYDVNGDTLFSVNTNTREVRTFGRAFLPNKADSSVMFTGAGGELQVDSANFVWNDAANSLRLGPFVNGFATSQRFVITGTSGTQSAFRIGCIGNAGSAVPTIEFFRARGTTTTPTAATIGSILGELNFGGYDGTSFGSTTNFIRGVASSTWTATNKSAFFQFTTINQSAANFNMYYTHAGTLSIGGSQNDTLYTLDVHGTGAIVITPPSTNGTDSLLVKSGVQVFATTLNSMIDTINAPSVTGSNAFSAFGINQTWNTTGSPTGIFANFTNTASGGATLVADFQVSGVSMFKVSKLGILTTGSSIISGSGVTASGGGVIGWNARSSMISEANGTILISNNAITDFGRLKLGGSTSAFPSIARQGQAIRLLLADTSGFAQLQTGQLSVNGAPQASAAVTINSTTQGFLPPVMTAAQGSAIATPAQGLMIFVTTTNGTFATIGWYGFDGANWIPLH